MTYTQSNPSPRYRELVAMYRDLHLNGEKSLGLAPEKTFDGLSLLPQAGRIAELCREFGAHTMLDYGSGKGKQYLIKRIDDGTGRIFDGIVAYWGLESVHCYDPGYLPHSQRPAEKFDAVISTDVLEHCPEEDVPWILDDMFGYARLFFYANVANFPAMKTLPNGENAHCTIKPVEWWQDILARTAARHPGVRFEVWVESVVVGPDGTRQGVRQRLAG